MWVNNIPLYRPSKKKKKKLPTKAAILWLFDPELNYPSGNYTIKQCSDFFSTLLRDVGNREQGNVKSFLFLWSCLLQNIQTNNQSPLIICQPGLCVSYQNGGKHNWHLLPKLCHAWANMTWFPMTPIIEKMMGFWCLGNSIGVVFLSWDEFRLKNATES